MDKESKYLLDAKKNMLFIIFAIILFICGIIGLSYAAYDSFKYTMRVEGVIVNIIEEKDYGFTAKQTVYWAEAEYCVEGKTYTVISSKHTSKKDTIIIGNKVEIQYLKDNPQKADIVDPLTWVGFVIGGIFLVSSILWGTFLIRAKRKG